MSGIGDDLREAMAENIEEQIEQGAIECPTDGCDSNYFDAEVGVTDSGGFEGAAVCRECNTRIELDLEDSDAQDAADDIESQLDDLNNL